jgi:predicted transcriptional regulator
VLAPNRLQIPRAMSGAGPLTLREIARRVDRDLKVSAPMCTRFSWPEMIDRVEDGFVFPFDAIRVDFSLQAAA